MTGAGTPSSSADQLADPPPVGLLRKVGYGFLAVATVWFVWSKRSEVPLAWQAIKAASPIWILAAVTITIIIMINQAMFYGSSQRALGVRIPKRDLWRTSNASFFINTLAKSGGLAGVTAFTSTSNRNGQSKSRTIAAYVVVAVLTQLGFALSLMAAIFVLLRSGGLTRTDLIGSVVFGAYTLILTLTGVAAFRSKSLLRKIHALPHRLKHLAFRVVGKPLPEEAIDTTEADELFDAIQLLKKNPRALVPTLVHAVVVEVLGIALLWATLHAVGANVGISVSLVAYSVSVMFFIIGILPGGLGFVEASLAVILAGFGLNAATIAAVVVIYRVLELWVPFGVGAVAARQLAAHR